MKAKVSSRTAGAHRAEAKAMRHFRLGLIQLHIQDQKAIFNRLAPALRAALWRDRLSEALKSDLTREQRAVLRQISERITPELYDPREKMTRKKFIGFYRLLGAQIGQAFGRRSRQFGEIATQLGPLNRTPRIAQGGPLPDCDCNMAAGSTSCDDCGYYVNCKRVPCVATASGCGCFWSSPCNGVCR